MMWIEKHNLWALINPCIGHHLVDISLRYAMPGIFGMTTNTLPFSVYHHNNLMVPLDKQIWSGLEAWFAFFYVLDQTV